MTRADAALAIREAGESDRSLVRALLREHWDGEEMVLRGTVFQPADERALIAWAHGQPDGPPLGLLTWRPADGGGWEILSLDAFPPDRGIGSALLQALEAIADRESAARLVAVTTNDNLTALAFWQKRGFRLVGFAPNAVAAARAIKPAIPLVAANGIPIRDELTLEKRLHPNGSRT